jgi:hypothetical protein
MFDTKTCLPEEETLIERDSQKRFSKVCAWCKEAYDKNVIEGSSGICNSCFKKLVKTYAEMLDVEQAKNFQKILNSIDARL